MHPTNTRAQAPAAARRAAQLAAAVMFGAGLAGTAHAQCSTSFGQPVTNYTAPSGSSGASRFLSRDFNGDGRLDLITVNFDTDRTSVRLATGNGTFGPDTSYATGNGPSSMATGDFNGDGRLDVVVLALNNPYRLTTLLASAAGDGTFSSTLFVNLPYRHDFIAAADFNGDGRGDIVLAAGALLVRSGNGDGTFGPPTAFSASPSGATASGLVTGDFNADGKPDLACPISSSNSVAVLLNNGPTAGVPSFAAPVLYPVGSGPAFLALGDVNADGRPDLVAVNRIGNSVRVLLCNSDGSFTNPPDGGTHPLGMEPLHVVIGDYNGDGAVDLAVSPYNLSSLTVLHGTGDGSFGDAIAFAVPVHLSTATGDYTGDGRLDIVGSTPLATGSHFWMLQNISVGAPIPTFTAHPVSRVVTAGSTVEFTAHVSNAQSYQWRRNGVPFSDGDLIWGAATNTLTITQASAADMATYDVRATSVSCSGTANHAFSAPAVLAVTTSTGPANDACAAPMLITNGTHTFTTINATTDGPSEANLGFCCNDNQIHKDVWFTYTATCTGVATFNLCASGFDTKIAIYNGANCPSAPNTAIAGNDDNGVCSPLGDRSQVSFNTIAGHHYRVRVGGYNNASGNASMTVSCDGSACLKADLGVQSGGFGRDGMLDNNDFIAFIEAFFSQTTCP